MWPYFFWLVFSIVAAVIASSKGRSGIGYFFLSIFLTPIVGLLLAAFLPAIESKKAEAKLAAEPVETHVKCPECKELVLAEARKCKHCGAALTPTEAPTEEQLMAQYGIEHNGSIYQFKEWRYDTLGDAIAQARRQHP